MLRPPRPATRVSRPFGPEVSRECPSGCLWGPSAPGLRSVQKCPESVPAVFGTPVLTLSGHFLDTPEPRDTPRDTPRTLRARRNGELSRTFLIGCFPVDFQEAKRPLRTESGKRPIKVGKRLITEGKRPIKATVLVGISIEGFTGCFRARRKTAPLKRPIKRSMKLPPHIAAHCVTHMQSWLPKSRNLSRISDGLFQNNSYHAWDFFTSRKQNTVETLLFFFFWGLRPRGVMPFFPDLW